MKWVVHTIHAMVNQTTEGFGSQPPVNEPFLIPDRLECTRGHFGDGGGKMRTPKSAKPCLVLGESIRIVVTGRHAKRAENHVACIEVGLKQHVLMHPRRQVAPSLNITTAGLILIRFGQQPAVLNAEPRVVVSEIVKSRQC